MRNEYINVKAAPHTNDTVRAGEAAFLAASMLPDPSDEFEAYAREASPVVARLRKENKYNAWSMHSVAGDRAAKPALPTVLPTNELSMFDSSGCIK